jgi:hypothetical protein
MADTKNPPATLDAVAIRLEAVKLVHRFDREPWQVLGVAQAYADWILTGTQAGPGAPEAD